MNEKYPYPQHNSGEEPLPEASSPPLDEPETGHGPIVEADSDEEWQLRWEITEVMLQVVDDIVDHPGDNAQVAVGELALRLIQATYRFDLTRDADKQALISLADTVANRIVALADAHDDLTTSDLQSGVEALALQLIRNQLLIPGSKLPKAGDHE
ncbi:hypothetical protein [Nocardia brasiliensis]|uniref:hypothetical protein n=1 Tax=Nocardia brasiliensis TaxID=37326 RepID=UPI003D8D0991